MERSLINEFKNSSSTLFHSTVLGTTSLLQRPKEGDLFKFLTRHADLASPTCLPIRAPTFPTNWTSSSSSRQSKSSASPKN
jgi:hypothetical protein